MPDYRNTLKPVGYSINSTGLIRPASKLVIGDGLRLDYPLVHHFGRSLRIAIDPAAIDFGRVPSRCTLPFGSSFSVSSPPGSAVRLKSN